MYIFNIFEILNHNFDISKIFFNLRKKLLYIKHIDSIILFIFCVNIILNKTFYELYI